MSELFFLLLPFLLSIRVWLIQRYSQSTYTSSFNGLLPQHSIKEFCFFWEFWFRRQHYHSMWLTSRQPTDRGLKWPGLHWRKEEKNFSWQYWSQEWSGGHYKHYMTQGYRQMSGIERKALLSWRFLLFFFLIIIIFREENNT